MTPPFGPAVVVDQVGKTFGRTRALDGISFTAGAGVTGLLGPNGAGKTTVLRMLATVLGPDRGRLRMLGRDPADAGDRLGIRRRLGYLPQEPGFHRGFTAFEFIDYVAILKEMTDRRQRHDEVRRVLDEVGLSSVSGKRIRALSGGMRRRAVTGVEALVRWQHPTRGLLSPAELIAVAEDTGLVVPLGSWVLQEACRQLQDWTRSSGAGLTVAVNVSARQLSDSRFPEAVADILAATGADPAAVVLELTETALLDATDASTATLQALRGLGVRLALDDFGTGFSSLTFLKRFPIDVVKVDRSFVRDIAVDPDDAAIVAAVVNLGRSLHLETVAEGVETAEQLACIRGLGCLLAQGYLLSPPRPPEDIPALLAAPGPTRIPDAVDPVVLAPPARPRTLAPPTPRAPRAAEPTS